MSTKSMPAKSRGAGYLLTAVIAFTAGALSVWLTMRKSPTTEIPVYAAPAQTGQAPSAIGEGLPPAERAVALGNWNYDHQLWDKAIGYYKEALAQGADNPDVRTDLGNCYRFTNRPREALEQYQIAQQQDARHENSLFNIATLHAQSLGDHAEAVKQFGEYLVRFPQGQNVNTVRRLLAESQQHLGRESEL
jgi:tetratricopeptide (TPR) repeat protein